MRISKCLIVYFEDIASLIALSEWKKNKEGIVWYKVPDKKLQIWVSYFRNSCKQRAIVELSLE